MSPRRIARGSAVLAKRERQASATTARVLTPSRRFPKQKECNQRRAPSPAAALETSLSRGRAYDARTGQTIVETAMIACQQSGEKSEASWEGQSQPQERPPDGTAKIERCSRIGSNHLDANRHLSKCLSANGKGHEVPSVLNEEVGDERTLGQNTHILEHQTAELQREIDDDRVNYTQDENVYGHRDKARPQARVLVAHGRSLSGKRVGRAPAGATMCRRPRIRDIGIGGQIGC